MLSAPYKQQIQLRQVSLYSKALLVVAIIVASNAPLEFFLLQMPALAPLNTLVWFALYLGAAVGLILTHGINWISWLVRYRLLLMLLLAGSLLLVPWSVDATLSINRLTHLFGTTLVAIFISFSLSLPLILRLLSATLFVLLFASLVTGQLFPTYGWEDYGSSLALKGIMDNKNTLGFWAGMALMLFPWTGAQCRELLPRFFWACATLMAVFILLQSRSAGSIIAVAIAITIVSYIAITEKIKLGFLAMALVAGLLGVILLLVFSGLNIAELTGRSKDLTGRTEVWSQTWALIQQRPLTGYGYGTLWFPTDATRWIQERYTDFTWVVFHAHNGALHLASEIGLPLSALALLFIMQQLVELVFCQIRGKHAGSLVALGFMLAFLITNYSEARFLQSRELFWLFFIAFPIALLRQVEVRETTSRTFAYPNPADNRVRYPDEFIPGAQTKLGKLRATKRTRRLRREIGRLAAPRSSQISRG